MAAPFLIGLAKMAATAFVSAAAGRLANEFTADDDLSDEETQERWEQFFDELRRELEDTKAQLEEERQKRKRHIVVVGVLCFVLGGLVGSSVWHGFQPSHPSEQIIALDELEKYERAREAGLQALEDYVIQNPNSPYISQAKSLIQTYRGKE